MLYNQCTLAWDDGKNVIHTVELVPESLVRLGNIIEVKNARGAWEPWMILSINLDIQVTPVTPIDKNYRQAD